MLNLRYTLRALAGDTFDADGGVPPEVEPYEGGVAQAIALLSLTVLHVADEAAKQTRVLLAEVHGLAADVRKVKDRYVRAEAVLEEKALGAACSSVLDLLLINPTLRGSDWEKALAAKLLTLRGEPRITSLFERAA